MEDKLHQILNENALLRTKIEALERGINSTPKYEYIDKSSHIIDMCCDMHWDFYPDKLLTIFSVNYTIMSGWEQLVYEDFSDIQKLVHPDDLPKFIENITEVMEGKKERFNYEFRWLCKDGTYGWLNNRCIAHRDSTGKINYIIGLANDITELRKNEESLKEEQMKNKLLLKTATDFIWEYDIKEKRLTVSDEMLNFLGEKNSSSIEADMQDFLNSSLSELQKNTKISKQLCFFNKRLSKKIWFEITYFALTNIKGKRYKLIGTMRNIDKLIQEQERLKDAAYIDHMTKLRNRHSGTKCLTELFQENRLSGKNFALMFLDFDDFKQINDTYGHAAGDFVLQSFAKKIQDDLSALQGVVFRWGGEEFLAFLPFENNDESIQHGKNICKSVAEMIIYWELAEITLTVSIGMTKFNAEDQDYDMAIKRADEALYKVKNSGKNNVCFLE